MKTRNKVPDATAMTRRRALLARMARPANDAPLRVFCSGIGGTGVSGLARLVAALGHRVRGSDRAVSPQSAALEPLGIEVVYEQGAGNLTPDTDLFVATAALPPTHPELMAAIDARIPVVKYAEALGELVAARRGLAIAGTHGKTTTTSLSAHLLHTCGRSPSYIVGGQPMNLPASAGLGQGEDLVFEACEFDNSFRHYRPAVAVILNVEEDHLDCYQGGLNEIEEAFVAFGARVREGGALIVNADCSATMRVARRVREVRPDLALDTFSQAGEARYAATNIRFERGLPRFQLKIDDAPGTEVRLALPGRHNVSNALAAIACAVRAGVSPEDAARAVAGFGGVRRRFDVLAQGDVTVVDDYAHHPTAIEAVIAATRSRYPNRRMVVAFEPHQASRTRLLFDDFVDALAGADRLFLGDIYICRDRQEDVRSVSAADLAAAVRQRAPSTEAQHVGDLAAVEEAATRTLGPGDVGLFLGAGRISQVAHRVAARFHTPPRTRTPRLTGGSLDRALRRGLGDRLEQEVSLAPYCTLKAGGRARFFSAPTSEDEAIQVVRTFRRHGVPVVPLGGGSNTLFTTDRFDGAVVLTRRMRGARVLGNTLRAVCGAGLQGILRLAEREGLGGLEQFAGIPGTVGGAVFGNAGGPPGGGSVGALVRRARVLEADGTVRWRTREELGLRYRGSNLEDCLVLSVDLELRAAPVKALREVRKQATKRKSRTQPLEARSAGCTFRNPDGVSAGRLIDVLGLKGLRRGGAQVSTLHANFIVNEGGASPQDVLGLMEEVRARVLAARGVLLETELRLIA